MVRGKNEIGNSMSEHTPIYSKSRFPKQIAPGTCRGCHGPITAPRRKTWCSEECKRRYDPYWVKRTVMARDKHICHMCGADIGAERLAWYRERPPRYPFDNWLAWRRREPREEFDHIVPFCEGGATVVENMRTLCSSCHKKRTAEWRKSKAVKRV
jgi:5-methylcytosine-specific restriction endonuclease McrA